MRAEAAGLPRCTVIFLGMMTCSSTLGVHFDRRYGTPACSGTTAGYPTLRRGSRGCYVMVLQDALSTLGYQTGSRIDGIFGARTEQALRGYQKRTSLRVDGVCGCDSWIKISTAVIGIGRTKTTID